ncbi:MAG: response regulator [Parvibaculum sp.]
MQKFSSATIYVVDDDDAVRDSMRALLESHGLTVRDYSSALHFLGEEERLYATEGFYGCLLLDLHMPGMDGAELLERLSERGSPLPVIVLTGRADATLRERVIRAGARALLEKPVTEDELKYEIGRALLDRPAD